MVLVNVASPMRPAWAAMLVGLARSIALIFVGSQGLGLRQQSTHGETVTRMDPPGPAFGRPDDKLRVIRGQPIPDYVALHPGLPGRQSFGPLGWPSFRGSVASAMTTASGTPGPRPRRRRGPVRSALRLQLADLGGELVDALLYGGKSDRRRFEPLGSGAGGRDRRRQPAKVRRPASDRLSGWAGVGLPGQ